MLLTLLSTLAINAAITGSSTLTFTPSGSLVTDGALTGGSTLTFSPSGSLSTDALISGGTSLTFATAGGLTTGAEMSGVTSLTFTTTGDLLTEAQLSGSQTLTFITSGDLTGGDVVEPPSGDIEPLPEVNWPGVERQRAALVSALISQAKERGKQWVEANKPQVRRTIRRAIERELNAQGLLSPSIMAEIAPMVSDALESLPLLDFDALQMQLAQYDLIIWQQAERLAEEYRLALLQDDEDALILIMAAA